jgi:hypothetical protein
LRVHEGVVRVGDWDGDGGKDSVCWGGGTCDVEFWTFRSLQIASVTACKGAGRWNVVNPVPVGYITLGKKVDSVRRSTYRLWPRSNQS